MILILYGYLFTPPPPLYRFRVVCLLLFFFLRSNSIGRRTTTKRKKKKKNHYCYVSKITNSRARNLNIFIMHTGVKTFQPRRLSK